MAVGGWDVFVSYGHEDAEWVRVLAGNLHRAGFEVFLDEWELVGGDRVTGRLEEGIRGSASGVLVVSPHSLSRPWVREEYEALLRQAVQQPGRRLIPVLYADAELPPFLANRLWVDFRGAATTGPEYEARLGELVRYLQGRPAADRPARDGAVQWPAGAGGEVVPAGRAAAGGADPFGGGGVAVGRGVTGFPRSRGGCGGRRRMRSGSWSGGGRIRIRGRARVRVMRRCGRRGGGWPRISWPGRWGRRWPPGSPRRRG